MIIDFHMNLYNARYYAFLFDKLAKTERARRMAPLYLEWVSGADRDGHDVEGWIASMDWYGIDKIVFVAAPHNTNDDVAAFIRQRPDRFIGFANIDLFDEAAPTELERCVREVGFRGIGELHSGVGSVSTGSELNLNDPRAGRVYEKALELGVPIMTHLGWCTRFFPFHDECRHGRDARELAPVLARFPDLIFILPHMGKTSEAEALNIGRIYKNLYFDLSAYSNPAMIGEFLTHVGPDRLIWGSDWERPYPSNPLERDLFNPNFSILRCLDDLGADAEEKAKILGANAASLLGLAPQAKPEPYQPWVHSQRKTYVLRGSATP